LKASAEFAAIGPRVLTEVPLDSWQEDLLHFFVFPLRPVDGAANELGVESDGPVAVFVMDTASPAPVAAVVVTPSLNGAEAAIQHLRAPQVDSVAPVLALISSRHLSTPIVPWSPGEHASPCSVLGKPWRTPPAGHHRRRS
jgi:hypothetical protein